MRLTSTKLSYTLARVIEYGVECYAVWHATAPPWKKEGIRALYFDRNLASLSYLRQVFLSYPVKFGDRPCVSGNRVV